MLLALLCGTDNSVRLVPKVSGKLAMRGHHLGGCVNPLAVTGGVRGNLGGLPTVAASPFKILTNLLAPGAGRVEIFLGIALDLWRSAPTKGDFVAEFLQTVG